MKTSPKTISMVDQNIELFREFLKEIKNSLGTADVFIKNLSRKNNKNDVQKLFEIFHTIKGLSAFLHLLVLCNLAEKIEELLDIMYRQNRAYEVKIYRVFIEIKKFFISSCPILDKTGDDISLNKKAENIILKIRNVIDQIKTIKIDLGEALSDAEPEKATSETDSPESSFEKLPGKEIFQKESGVDSIMEGEWSQRFLAEALDNLSSAENNFLFLDKDLTNIALISLNFRNFHTLKASAGMFGFVEIEKISMEIETILDDVRSEKIPLTKDIIHPLLKKIDSIRKEINNIVSTENKTRSSDKLIKGTINMEDKPQQNIQASPVHPEKVHTPKQEESKQVKDIRVDMMKLDKLFDLVGELITAEVMISSNPSIKKMKDVNLNKAIEFLDRITRDLQETTLSIRMTPLDDLFNKMKRLVHDLSFKFNKEIEFEISGQDTEMDKKVIEELSDPLVHILRNALDHGIEPKEERIQKNKNGTGKISLSARYEGNEILVLIQDDGRGLSREKILEKAILKGLVTGPPDSLKDEEVWDFIFEAGFSTAEVVTEVSGRGVGMDVVRKNLEKIKGKVEIWSEYGKGSTFILRIPLTLAIMDGIIVKVGDTLYSIPILSICESFRPKKSDISKTMDGLEMVKIRDEIFPVIRLYEMFGKKTEVMDLDKGTLVLVESKTRKSCLLVDSILDEQQVVVKGLSDYIGKVEGVSGCMIMGDGSIGLILDIEDIVRRSENLNIRSQELN